MFINIIIARIQTLYKPQTTYGNGLYNKRDPINQFEYDGVPFKAQQNKPAKAPRLA